ncbi:phenylalanyl-tRNA synthetase beta [Cyclospora cayetanensis]|uniref:phenylalanine--tRNA ligase n=1 Tax=Cyclospora cayetanensis TaxID=88456 RepID=A0A1D3D9I0_9EIME|nr:phenylalanyl-tRNA synthetase beta [Cyclospora cayetanensis]
MPTVPIVAEELYERLSRIYSEPGVDFVLRNADGAAAVIRSCCNFLCCRGFFAPSKEEGGHGDVRQCDEGEGCGGGVDGAEDELDALCFSFGVELDEVTEQDGQKVLKIDVPANRYDLLCVEGLGRALKVFLSQSPLEVTPQLRHSGVPRISMRVKASAQGPRPFIACAVLRGVRLNQRRLQSCIELQDKLHHTLCRRRALASIGTYDLSMLEPPFTYEALPPQEVCFQPLGCGALPPMTGPEILAHFSNHTQLKQYLHMLEGQPRLYLLRDAKGNVLSMPPLINSDFCRLTEASRDIFIDCTSVDARKGEMALVTVAAMLAEYCEEPFAIEPVRVIYEEEGRETITPSIESRKVSVDMATVRQICGLKDLPAAEAAQKLCRLMLPAKPDPSDPQNSILVSVPPTRMDVMHPCDIAEDVAIGIGFDRLPVTPAPKLPANRRSLLTQSLRTLLTSLGFTECLTFALCSAEDNAQAIRKPLHPHFEPTTNYDPLEHQWLGMPVLLSNAKTRELTETRTQLISGLLKSLANNVGRREMPIRLFEVGDVVIRDDRTETGSRNLLYCCAAFADEHGSGLEEVHGLVDAALEALGLIGDYEVAERKNAVAAGREEQRDALKNSEKMRIFSLRTTNLPTFLPGRQVEISVCRLPGMPTNEEGKETARLTLGHMGTLHVDCLRNFGLAVPGECICSDALPLLMGYREVAAALAVYCPGQSTDSSGLPERPSGSTSGLEGLKKLT